MMKYIFLCLVALVCYAAACDFTISHYEPVEDFRLALLQGEVSWKAFGRTWELSLSLSDLFTGNREHFHGSLKSDASAIVSFSLLLNGTFRAMILTANETFWLGPVNVDGAVQLFMHKQSDVKTTGDDCEPPLSAPWAPDAPAEEGTQQKRAINSYKVAVFVDQLWASSSNNPWSTNNDIYSLFNEVNAVYSAAGLGQFQVAAFGTINNNGMTTTSQMLPYFSTRVGAVDSSYTNSIWLVGTNIGGLAYLGATCRGAGVSQRTAVAGLTKWNRLWTVKTIAHELGHNRGAPHDFNNQCSSANRANCNCSVMSYCFPTTATAGGAVNYFSQRSINSMRTAGCL